MWWLSTLAGAWVPLQTCGNSYAAWNGPSHWVLHDQFAGARSFSNDLDDAVVLQAVRSGFDVWEAPTSCCSGFRHVYDGSSGASGYNTNDGINAITFEESNWNPAFGSVNSTIAVTTTSFTGNCRIPEANQVYNGVGFTFTAVANPGFNQTDLQSIAAHENGHWLGLGHSSTNSASMYFAYTGGTGARSLHLDDEEGACTLYPAVCGPPEDCDDGLDNDNDGQTDCDDADCRDEAVCLEGNCTDGLDGDSDGLTDCDDPDCAAEPSCECAVAGVLTCGIPVSGSTVGGPNTVQQWACANWLSTGPEAIFAFTPPGTGHATVTLSGLSADLDLFITQGNRVGQCDPWDCVSQGGPDLTDEVRTLPVIAGQTYVVVADGWEGAAGTFTLQVDCPPGPPTPPTPATPPAPNPGTAAPTPTDGEPRPTLPLDPAAPLQGGCSTTPPARWFGLSSLLVFALRRRR